MLEAVTYPANLSQWDSETSNFYMELYGETSPELDMTYAEVLPIGAKEDSMAQTQVVTPIYQYWWTIGQSRSKSALRLSENLRDDPAARVYLYFPLDVGWRIKEFTASVKYLTPIPKHVDWLQKLSAVWNKAEPFVDQAALLTALLPKPFDAPSSTLSTLAKLKFNEVPPVDDFAWSVGKVTRQWQKNVMEGVMWNLPKKMFTDIGGRITGSLAVSFIPAPLQMANTIGTAYTAPLEGRIRAQACIYLKEMASPDIFPSDSNIQTLQDDTMYLPAEQGFIELLIRPAFPKDTKANTP